ncbi:heat shock 70 kDa protein 15-like isoform X1 [Iris pallida]|uniref:Heat shock 70 kDa protein 15-like isoform X1 n=1 Tax=Iris pallida TaxID=29817 RepID=A0AAX6ENY6_IRIPA|nr:heat shock 70 kDa protein 15-like isoform X1 [Iris pallida]
MLIEQDDNAKLFAPIEITYCMQVLPVVVACRCCQLLLVLFKSPSLCWIKNLPNYVQFCKQISFMVELNLI